MTERDPDLEYSDDVELFESCINAWGGDAQLLMVVEEINELSLEILHLLRKNKVVPRHRIRGEYVDARLMLDQFEYMMDFDLEELHKEREKAKQYVRELLMAEGKTIDKEE